MFANTLWSTLLITIDCTLPACLIYARIEALKMLPSTLLSMLSRTLPIALDGTLQACLSNTPIDAPKMLSSTLPNMLPCTLPIGNTTWLYASIYVPGCSSQRLAELQVPRTGRHGGVSQIGVGRITTSVIIIVWTIFLAWPLWRDLMMPHGHGIDNCCRTSCRKWRQLHLAVSRPTTKIFLRNLVLTQAGNSISHYHHSHSAWQRTEQWQVYGETGMTEMD